MATVAQLESIIARLEAVASKFEGGAAPAAAAGGSSSGASSAAVGAFDELLNSHGTAFSAAAAALGGAVQKQAEAIRTAFAAQRDLIAIASTSQKPSDADFPKLLQATSAAIGAVQGLQDNRSTEKNHLAMAANGIEALGWVAVSPAPAPFIGEMIAAAQTYGNKVLMEHRNTPTGAPHVTYVKAYVTLLTELQAYVKQNHTTGLSWNAKGGNALSASAASAPKAAPAAAPAAASGKPAGPPPPPSADFLKAGLDKKPAAGGGGGVASLLSEISKGEAVTSGLKKVTDDMKAKNRTDRTGVVSVQEKTVVPKELIPTKPPKLALEDKKWVVEHQVDSNNLEINGCTSQQAVYVYKCIGRASRTVLQIKEKVKVVSLDDCFKTSVVVQGVVASVDIVNCKRCEIQINGSVPTLTLDNVNGLTIYLTHPDALQTRIISSKCSEINVVLPKEGDDPSEVAIPEQYETVVQDGKLVTVPVSHVGV